MDQDSDDDEAILSAFKCNSRKCGMKCHMAKDCRAKGKNRKKFNGTCNGCGRDGHEHKEYWLLDSNANKTPHNWRGGSRNLEATAIHTDDPLEIVLPMLDIEDSDEEIEMQSLLDGGHETDSSSETIDDLPMLLERGHETDSSGEDDEDAVETDYYIKPGWK